MIRLTVLYDLPTGTSEEDFLQWRLSEHQESNAAMAGVQRTDFSRISEHWPAGSMPTYRFQTTVEWADREAYESAFLSEQAQRKLDEDLKKLGDYTFFVSETLVESGV